MPPFHLTLADVKAAARLAHSQGKLTAQHPDRDKRYCVYRVDGCYHCAIGAALPPRTIDELAWFGFNDYSAPGMYDGGSAQDLGTLAKAGFITLDEHERDDLMDIQGAHDQWANLARYRCDTAEPAERRFLKLIAE